MKLTTKLTIKKHKTNIITGALVALVIGGFAWSARPSAQIETPTAAEAPAGMDEATHQSHHPEEAVGATQESNALAFEPAAFDFGKISMANGNVSQKVKVRNASTAPVMLKKLYTSCMCTTALLTRGDRVVGPFGMPGHGPIPTFSETLAPGAEAELEIVFNPNAHGPAGVGPVKREVYLETDSGRMKVQFSAYVTP